MLDVLLAKLLGGLQWFVAICLRVFQPFGRPLKTESETHNRLCYVLVFNPSQPIMTPACLLLETNGCVSSNGGFVGLWDPNLVKFSSLF